MGRKNKHLMINYKYIVYITINLCNGKFYIGVHKTINTEVFDGYIGNGVYSYTRAKYLQKKNKQKGINIPFVNAVVKYGYENFKRTTLSVFETEEEAFKMESKLVTDVLIKSKSCYNVALGGKVSHNTQETKVYKFALNGNFLQSYKSISSAARENNIDQAGIIRVLKGDLRSCGNFYWNTEKTFDYVEYNNKKPICQYTLNGKLIAVYESIKEAREKLGTTSIHRAIKTQNTAAGFQWRYFEGLYDDINPYVRKTKKDDDIV